MIIKNAELKYLDKIIEISKNSGGFMAQNNRMIYYLCCTVFSKYSFIAIKKDNNEENVVGFIFVVRDSYSRYLWIHQLAVMPDEKEKLAAGSLIHKLLHIIDEEKLINGLRFAIRTDNKLSYSIAMNFNNKSFAKKGYSCKSLGISEELSQNFNMEVFEVSSEYN